MAKDWKPISWNPTTGCTKISNGCLNCYAERYSLRHQYNGMPKYRDGFAVRMHSQYLNQPFSWKTPRNVFVNSMSDLMHPAVTDEFIRRVFFVMNNCPQHSFFIITKRSERLAEIAGQLEWTPNIWVGVTVERPKYFYRIDHLRSTPAHVKFINFEPLLEPVGSIDFRGIDYVIVGGETGPNARRMEKLWVLDIERQCMESSVPFFFKKWSRKSRPRRKFNNNPRTKSKQLQLTFD